MLVAAPARVTPVTLFGKPGCHICADVRARLWPLAAVLNLEVEEVDILGDEALFARYRDRVPVLAVAGREAFEGPWSPAAERLLRRVARGRWRAGCR